MTSLLDITPENYQGYLARIFEIENLSFPCPWTLDDFVQEIKNPLSHLWASRVDGVFSGYICFRMFESEIQVLKMAVHPKKRGKGLGQDLLTKMIEAGMLKGIEYVWLEVRPSNLAAQKLYEKLGFGEVHRRPRYYEDTTEDAIVMGLTLFGKETYGVASSL